MFTIVCCLVVESSLGLGLELDLVSDRKLLCTHICATSGSNCHTTPVQLQMSSSTK